MAKPEHEFFPHDDIPWLPVAGVPGLERKILVRDEETGDWTQMSRFAPGTDTTPMGVQEHDFWEEVFIVSGSLHDLTLDRLFGEGSYACRPPGMPHGPWRTEDGCVTFEVCRVERS